MTKQFTCCLPVFLLAMALPLAASAADAGSAVAKQMATADAHAGMALGASSVKMTHTHLHHVVNCLVGPGGKGFYAKAGDPCKGMGHGAIVDARGDAATEATLHTALSEARKGLKASTLDSAHADAKEVFATLQAK